MQAWCGEHYGTISATTQSIHPTLQENDRQSMNLHKLIERTFSLLAGHSIGRLYPPGRGTRQVGGSKHWHPSLSILKTQFNSLV